MGITSGSFIKLKSFLSLTSSLFLVLNFKSGGGQLQVLKESVDFDGRPREFKKLTCLVDGPNYDMAHEWYHNGTLISWEYISKFHAFRSFRSHELLIYLSRADLRYQGVYQSFVSSAFGRIFCRKIKVKFKVEGKFASVSTPVIRQVTVGQPFHLRCPAHTYTSGCVYQWGKNGHFGLKHVKEYGNRIVLSDGTLFFSAIKDRDMRDFGWREGGYSCILDCVFPEFHTSISSHKIGFNATQVNASSFGPQIVTTIKDREVALGTKYVHVICAASGSPTPSYRWVKIDDDDNAMVDIAETKDFKLGKFNHTLTIHNIKISHNGTYACIAMNNVNYDLVKWKLLVREKPTWLSDGKITNKMVHVFTNLTWECKARGDPVPTYTWYCNASEIVTRRGRYEINGGKISFNQVLLQDSGMYQCVAENHFGFNYQTVSLRVQARRPEFNETNVNAVFFKKSQGTLSCQTNAIPLANYTWTKNGLPLSSNAKYNIMDREILVVNEVAEEDAGIYECIAENVFGKARKVTNVTIEDIKFVLKPTSNHNVMKGTSFSLRCKVKSSRQVQYKWRFNGHDLTYDERRIWFENGNILNIQNATENDIGRYECVAYLTTPANVERSAAATIFVTGPPNALEGFQLKQECDNFTAILTWRRLPAFNKSEVLVTIEWRSTYDLDGIWQRDPRKVNAILGETRVVNLSPWSKVMFRAIAENSYGNGPASETTKADSCLLSPTRPFKCPENIVAVPGGPGVLDIEWKAMTKIDFNAPGFNYVVKYKRPNELTWKKTVVHSIQERFTIPNAGTNKLWFFTLQTNNSEGLGPMCLENSSYSGQSKPGVISKLTIKDIGTSNVRLAWLPPLSELWHIEEYELEYWQVGVIRNRRKRGESHLTCDGISNNPCSIRIPGESDEYSLTALKPMTEYNISLKACNSKGNGPPHYSSFQTSPLITGEQSASPAVYKRNWFISTVAIIALLMFVILFVIFILNIKRSDRYPVGKRERKKGGLHNLYRDSRYNSEPIITDDKPTNRKTSMYNSNGSTIAAGDEVSLALSTEDKYDDDGSFLGEYSDLTSTTKYEEMFV